MNGKETIEVLSEFANGSIESRRKKQIQDAFHREHRTLQRGIFCVCLDVIEALAGLEPSQVDGRNEQSHMMAKKIVDSYGKDCRPWLV